MHEYLCAVTAFRFHRIPPQVLAILEPFPDISTRAGKLRLLGNATYARELGFPLHVLTSNRNELNHRKSVIAHLWSGDLPSGSFMENQLDVTIASPLFTLLTLAPHVSETHLLMAMYEFCGTFSVYRPAPPMQQALDLLKEQKLLDRTSAWEQVYDVKGRPTSLWRRDPLIQIDELRHFAQRTSHMHGHKKFLRAAQTVTGVTASPLEAQVSIRLALSRMRGGEGFPCFTNNRRIDLSPAARRLANRNACYADLFFEANEDHRRPVDVECQGGIAHNSPTRGGLDADRTTALESMGIDVILLSARQIRERRRFQAAVKHIASKLGIALHPKTKLQEDAEIRLASELFIDWETLGTHREKSDAAAPDGSRDEKNATEDSSETETSAP